LKILVTFALENEFAPWRKMAGFRRVAVSEVNVWYEAQIGAAEVRVVITGTGAFAAQKAMKTAFESVPDFCIASGLAGSLKPEHVSGDVLVGHHVTEIKSGRSLAADTELRQLAGELGAKPVEKFLVAERVVATVAEKRQLAAMGDAVEMEGVYVLGAAAQHGVRCVAIRSISDTVDRDLPLDFDRVFDASGHVSVTKVIGQVAEKPGRLGGLVRLAEDSGKAARALAEFLNEFVQRLSTHPYEHAKADAIAI
jgi:adenosylhomocysteine nucleosidase